MTAPHTRRILSWKVAVGLCLFAALSVVGIYVAVLHGAKSQDIVPYLGLAGGAGTIFGVWWNLSESGRRRDEDLARSDRQRIEDAARADALRQSERIRELETNRSQLIGAARVTRSRLGIIYQTGGSPIDGYGAFERFISTAYSGKVADLVTDRNIGTEHFEDLSLFEQALGSMRYSLKRVADLARDDMAYRPNIELARDAAIAAAHACAEAVDRIRARLGDQQPISDLSLPVGELAPSVRRRLQDHPEPTE